MNRSLKTIIGGSITIFSMTLGAAFFGFLVRMMLTRKLSVEDFGLFYAILAFVAPIGLLKNFGVNRALIKFIPEYQQAGDQDKTKEALNWAAIISLLTSLVVVIPFFFLSDWLGKVFFHSQLVSDFFRIMLIYFILSTIGGVFSSFFNGLKRPFLLSSRSFLTAILILGAVFFVKELQLIDLCIIHVATHGVVVCFSAFALLRIFPYFKIHSSMTFTGIKRLLSFGLKAMTSPLVNKFFGRLDIILLTYFKNLAEVGFYSAAQPFARLFTIFGSSIGKMLFPYSSEIYYSRDKKELQGIISNLQRLMLFILAPIAIVFLLFSSQLLNILFGQVYQAGSLVVRLLVIGTLVHSFTIINTNVISGIGHPLKVTRLMLLNSLLNLTGNLLLIPAWGMDGAAISTLVAYWAMFFASCRYIKLLVGHSFDWKLLAKISLSSLLMVLILQAVKTFITEDFLVLFSVFIPLSCLVYLSFCLLSGVFSRVEIIKTKNTVKQFLHGIGRPGNLIV